MNNEEKYLSGIKFGRMVKKYCKYCANRNVECPDCGKNHLCEWITWFVRKMALPDDEFTHQIYPELKELKLPFIEEEQKWNCSKYKQPKDQSEIAVWDCYDEESPQLTDIIHPDQITLFGGD